MNDIRNTVKPYLGNENYVFISYAHSDMYKVYPILSDLVQQGFRVWFDQGLTPGRSYHTEIAEHIEKSSVVIAFISQESANSEYCNMEISYALNDMKKILIPVYLEDTILPSGIKMLLSSTQGIFKYEISDYRIFLGKLSSHDALQICKGAVEERATHLLTDESFSIGSVVLNRYEILNQIGKGGTSVVYLAFDKHLNQPVAVKHYNGAKTDITTNQVIINSILDEIDFLKSFNSPNIPRLIDVSISDCSYTIVMSYIDGKPLQAWLRENDEVQDDLIEMALKLCNILDYLHRQNPPVIYRDMKPANVMINSDNDVYLLDFGTARRFKENVLSDTVCLGTIGYAAPEQFGGMGQSDIRTDIYGFGITLFHMITGINPSSPPYEIKPLRKVNPFFSKRLENIILKCTQRNPNDRYQNIKDVANDLRKIKHVVDNSIKSHIVYSLTKLKDVLPRKETNQSENKDHSNKQFIVPGEPIKKDNNFSSRETITDDLSSEIGSLGTTILGVGSEETNTFFQNDSLDRSDNSTDFIEKTHVGSKVMICIAYCELSKDSNNRLVLFVASKSARFELGKRIKLISPSWVYLSNKVIELSTEKEYEFHICIADHEDENAFAKFKFDNQIYEKDFILKTSATEQDFQVLKVSICDSLNGVQIYSELLKSAQ